MSVTVTNTQGAAYLWSASTFAWDSAEGGKAWDDAAATSFVASDTDGIGISPRETRLPLTSRSEGLAFGDARRATAIASRSETMGFAETYIDLIAFIMKVVESIAINERLPKQITPAAFKDTFGLSGAYKRTPLKVTAELLSAVDARQAAAQRIQNRSLMVGDLRNSSALIPRASAFGVIEGRYSALKPDARQTLGFTDTYIDLIAFVMKVVEQISVADRRSSSPTHRSAETLALLDRILRASEAVIADLAFRATPLDEEGFAALVNESRPLGFAAFRELTPGDYEYAKALIRLVLEAPVTTANRIALSDAQLNIDVPDVRDRGAVAVPVGGFVVAFNRTFNAPPEVQASFKGGTSLAIPQIGTISATGFQLSLVNPETQNTVAGNASWSAEGF